jgi:hypothetical protein
MRYRRMIAPAILATAAMLSASSPSVSALKWERRILLVCARSAEDPALQQQRRIVASWKAGATERDLIIVEIVGEKVVGASDRADALRRRYDLPTDAFAVILIGKDGGTKLRRTEPIPAVTLEGTIDAMPMRRGGGR